MDGTVVATVVAAGIGAVATVVAAWIGRHRSEGERPSATKAEIPASDAPRPSPSAAVSGSSRSMRSPIVETKPQVNALAAATKPSPRSNSATPQTRGEIIRTDGSRERYIGIGFNTFGNSFNFAFDENGVNKRELNAADVAQIDFLGSPYIHDASGRLLRNRWAPAKITLRSGKELTGVFLNISGLGGWAWSYGTGEWRGTIDEHVSAIIFFSDPNEKAGVRIGMVTST